MSIVIGVVTKKCGLVVSDARVTNPDYTINDNYDKTFKIIRDNFSIIGTVAGLMEFENKRIGVHLEELLLTDDFRLDETLELIGGLANRLKNRLENIDENEVSFEYRNLDLILITSKIGRKAASMYSYCFKTRKDTSEILIESNIMTPTEKWPLKYATYGDLNSQASIKDYLDKNDLKKIKPEKLRSKLKKLIEEASAKSKENPQNQELTCGGIPFVKLLIY